VAHRYQQIGEQVEELWVEVMDLSRAMVTEEAIQLSERLRQVGVASAVYNIHTLSGMGMVELKTAFALGRDCGGRRNGRTGQMKHYQSENGTMQEIPMTTDGMPGNLRISRPMVAR